MMGSFRVPFREASRGRMSKISTPSIFPRISRRSIPVDCSRSVGTVPGLAPGPTRSSIVLTSSDGKLVSALVGWGGGGKFDAIGPWKGFITSQLLHGLFGLDSGRVLLCGVAKGVSRWSIRPLKLWQASCQLRAGTLTAEEGGRKRAAHDGRDGGAAGNGHGGALQEHGVYVWTIDRLLAFRGGRGWVLSGEVPRGRGGWVVWIEFREQASNQEACRRFQFERSMGLVGCS